MGTIQTASEKTVSRCHSICNCSRCLTNKKKKRGHPSGSRLSEKGLLIGRLCSEETFYQSRSRTTFPFSGPCTVRYRTQKISGSSPCPIDKNLHRSHVFWPTLLWLTARAEAIQTSMGGTVANQIWWFRKPLRWFTVPANCHAKSLFVSKAN